MSDFKNNLRVIMATLNAALLIGLVIEGYVNDSWDTLKILAVLVVAMNIVRFAVIERPHKPEIKINADPQVPGQAPDGK
jgi:hypothetical protein